MDWQLLKQQLSQANYLWLVLSMFVSMLSHLFRAWRWQLLIQAAGSQVKVIDAFAAVLVGYMANAAVPRMGEISRCTVLTTKTKTSFPVLAGTVVTERALDVLTLLSLIILAFFLQYQRLITYFQQFHFSPWLIAGIITFGLLLLFIFIKFRKKFLAFPLINKVYTFVSEVLTSAMSIFKLKNVGLFSILTMLIWLSYTLSTFLATYIFASTTSIGFELSFILMVMGGIGMTLPVPGGLGPFHNAIIWTLVAFGYAKSDGEALALIIHTPQLIMLVVTGAISYFYLLSTSKIG